MEKKICPNCNIEFGKEDINYEHKITPALWKQRVHCSRECYIQSQKENGSNSWKGKEVGIKALHIYMRKKIKKPKQCPNCNKKTEKLDLCNISKTYNSKTYNRNPKNWFYSCRVCHLKSDGRYGKFIKSGSESSKRPVIKIEGCLNHYYSSITEASRKTGIDTSSISKVCINRRKSAGNYKWEYADKGGGS